MANLYSLFESRFPADRSAPCFLLPDGARISYGDLETGAARLGRLLLDGGVGCGDRVVVQASKSPQMIMLYLAVLRIGAVFVPLNSAYTAVEIEYFLADAEPRLFVDDPVALMERAARLDPVETTVERADGDMAALIYTSGTTGRSKGAMLGHGALAANAQALHAAWGFTRDDCLLHALPIFHVHGLFVATHCSLLSGGPMLWFDRFDDAAVLKGLSRATVMMGVPTFYARLLASPALTRDSMAGMRLFISGSAPLLETTFAAFEARTGHRILERYGMSEAAIITSNPLDGARMPGSVGYPLPGVELRVSGGETGSIEIRTPSLFSGYWRMPEKTAAEFTPDGYFVTGDIGRQDADGRLWISGRAKDLIISGGYNVYPKEIELVLDTLPGIVESAVIGVPHPDFGEMVVAVVEGQGDEASIIAQARSRLAGFKTPKRVLFLERLPRNTLGKVQKAALRQEHAYLAAGA